MSRVRRATLLRGFEPQIAEIGGLRTRYWVGGAGPPLLLVHGLAGAAYNFTELAPHLARRRRVLIPDLPGHGGTAALPAMEGLGDLARHAGRVAEHEGMGPAAVLGYSMGGILALRLAAEQPDAVGAVVLLASAGIVSTTRRAELWLAATTALRPARLVAHARETIARRPGLRSPVFGYWGPKNRATSLRRRCWASSKRSRSTPMSSGRRGRLRATIRAPISTACAARRSSCGGPATGSPLEDGFEFARRLRAPLRVLPATGHSWSASALRRAPPSSWIG